MGNAGLPDQKRPRLLCGSIGNGVGLMLRISSGLAAQTAFSCSPLACGLTVGFTLGGLAGDAAAGGTGGGFGTAASDAE